MDNKFKKEIVDKLVEHDQRFDKMDQRFDKIDQRFDKMDQRFERMEEANHQLGIKFEDSQKNQQLILDVVLATQEKFEKYEKLDKQVQDHGHRIAAVEHSITRHPD